ncbi:YlbG family protein [Furfurilactobacillus rossiae]|uniref:DUF2129 domain-containing protein n=1 Tax=Furfurilactobacillus rossiae DSM 15814 TaxID=1114972 RepID=A0A0R1RLE8_9LACO|nr:YlbG family protein [Furfurilactobacillus rossiae]KRL57065.1 hypothetical protein FD35_GL000071 [Furfurilactobacillus rossiae DSM 15814]QFR66042.1 DUF2129 domain-containing protein [Furfurilactobacillus rossiae]QLE61466.1 hypothetical protein LROSRS0_1420 [Furfurilactobacillus rossiae]
MSEEKADQNNGSKGSTGKNKQAPRRNNHHPRRRSKSNQQRNNKPNDRANEEEKQDKTVKTASDDGRQNRSAGQLRRRRSQRKPNKPSRQDNVHTAEKTVTASHSVKTNSHGVKRESEQKRTVSRSHRNRTTTHSSMNHSKSEIQHEKNSTTVSEKRTDGQNVPAKSEEVVVRANLADAFVNHDPEKLVPQARQALHVFVRNLRQVRQLRRFGDIEYISKKLHYVVIYMDQDDISRNQQAINKLSFVRRVMVSERPEIDPFVGEGVNANFVTHTENDGAADAIPDTDQTTADRSGSAATKSTEAH